MSIGKRLLLFSNQDPHANELQSLTRGWGCMVTACSTAADFRGRVEGGQFDYVMAHGSSALKELLGSDDPEAAQPTLPLKEVEKRHIMRVLAYAGGNKTRAAKILGIDTKTLYNRLKAYESAAEAARRRGREKGGNNAIAG